MTILSAQSIKRLCQTTKTVRIPDSSSWLNRLFFAGTRFELTREIIVPQIPMLESFIDHKQVQNGVSYGLSSASYDVRIAHDLDLEPKGCGLAHSIERFCMPDNVAAMPVDKSSYARRFVFAMNTFFDPGFSGIMENGLPRVKDDGSEDPYASAVLEIVNLGEHPISIKTGDPICQFIFMWLDEPTDRPYRGKYQGQAGAQAYIAEKPTLKP